MKLASVGMNIRVLARMDIRVLARRLLVRSCMSKRPLTHHPFLYRCPFIKPTLNPFYLLFQTQTNLISLAETGAQVELLDLPAVPVANSDTLFPPAKLFEALQGLGLEIGMQPEEVVMPVDGWISDLRPTFAALFRVLQDLGQESNIQPVEMDQRLDKYFVELRAREPPDG